MSELGVPTNWVTMLEVGAASLEVRQSCGVPQRSPSSPILFVIFIDGLLCDLRQVRQVNLQAVAGNLNLVDCWELQRWSGSSQFDVGLGLVEQLPLK